MSAVLEQVVSSKSVPHLSIVPVAASAPIEVHATILYGVFSMFVRSKLNVRKKKGANIKELAALIRSQGLLQNLIGYPQRVNGVLTGIIEIVAGGRRLESIGYLIGEGDLPDDFSIPYLLVSEEEAIAISLAENSGREPMHPADMFDAMHEMSRIGGRSAEDIADAFGVEPITVKKRLKLANVSPRLFALYREDKMNLDQMQALAVTDDHKAQEHAWDSVPQYNRHASTLRRLLTAQEINIQDDRVARYVGMEAYEAAGGTIRRDLFSDRGDGYISDAVLLESLASTKLSKSAKKLEKEGFAWVDVRVRMDQSEFSDYAKVRVIRSQPTLEQKAELVAIDAELEKIDDERYGESEEEEEKEINYVALNAREAELNKRRKAITSQLEMPHPGDKALAGAVVTIDENGKIAIVRDLIRAEDKSKLEKITPDSAAADDSKKAKPVHSDRLTGLLTKHRTAALQAELMNRPDVAMVALTHSLIKSVFYTREYGRKIIQVSLQQPQLTHGTPEVERSRALVAFQTKHDELEQRLPTEDEQSLFAWLLDQPQSIVFEYMAFCTACSANAVLNREAEDAGFRELANAVSLDMRNWWTATGESYFNHVSKKRIVDVVTQAASPEIAHPLGAMRKEVAVQTAERTVGDKGWLPEMLRTE